MKSPSLRTLASLLAAAVVVFQPVVAVNAADATPPHRFEKNVQAYEEVDRKETAPRGAILLVGDSQFYRWKTLSEDLPRYTIINRGIDSFQLGDLLHFFDRLVKPYHPRMIVLHVGGNDVHNGRTAEQIRADFQTFVERVRVLDPNVPIAFSSITPGPGRWTEAPQRREVNQVVKAYVATQENLHFVDLWDAMLTSDGKPREDIWVEDRVHPNHEGYLIRVKIMKPMLGAPDKK